MTECLKFNIEDHTENTINHISDYIHEIKQAWCYVCGPRDKPIRIRYFHERFGIANLDEFEITSGKPLDSWVYKQVIFLTYNLADRLNSALSQPNPDKEAIRELVWDGLKLLERQRPFPYSRWAGWFETIEKLKAGKEIF
ncbi:MAG: hypothetical protein ABIH72_03035 [archaeon]